MARALVTDTAKVALQRGDDSTLATCAAALLSSGLLRHLLLCHRVSLNPRDQFL